MQRLNEELALVASIGPATVNSTPALSAWVSAAALLELLAVFNLGDMANETIDLAIYQAQDGSGTGAKVLKAATQLAASASANDSKQVLISADPARLDTDNGFTFVALRAVTGNTTGGSVCGNLWARPRYKPASHQAAVVQQATI